MDVPIWADCTAAARPASDSETTESRSVIEASNRNRQRISAVDAQDPNRPLLCRPLRPIFRGSSSCGVTCSKPDRSRGDCEGLFQISRSLVRAVGVEPTLCHQNWILKLLRRTAFGSLVPRKRSPQCDTKEHLSARSKRSLVTPPRAHSRNRLWP